jgi:hypothetical protein
MRIGLSRAVHPRDIEKSRPATDRPATALLTDEDSAAAASAKENELDNPSFLLFYIG